MPASLEVASSRSSGGGPEGEDAVTGDECRRHSGPGFLHEDALLVVGAVVFSRPDTDPTTEVVSAPDAVVATLDATGDGQSGTVQIVWSDDQNQVAVIASDLGDPGEGMAYALWFLLEDGVAPAGLFSPDDGAVTAVLDVDDVDTTGWGITIEPETGSEQPTTPVLFAGNL